MNSNRLWVLAAVAVGTALLVILALNFAGPSSQIEERIGYRYSAGSDQFEREMGVLLGPGILGGNRVQALENGDEIFPAMMAAVASAQQTITFETYIYWSGAVGAQFASALAERARAGVAVHVLVDWAGAAKMDDALADTLTHSGVAVEFYRPLAWYTLSRLNNRTHRKLLVVDGAVGFTGGVGIADVWSGDAQDPDHWRDLHFQVEGPVVGQLQTAFMDNWIETTGEVLNGPDYFPPLAPVGESAAQVFTSSPAGGSDSMRLMYLMALAAADETIDIAAAYFVPDALILRALVDAAERGVRVRILVPGEHIDSDLVAISSKPTWGSLLATGVSISQYTPTMYHTKMLIVDRKLVSVGSTNFDVRSFELNDEASLNIYDPAFAEQMTTLFEGDLALGEPYTLAEWTERPWTEKLGEIFLRPLKSQL